MDRRAEWLQDKLCQGLGITPELFEQALYDSTTAAVVTRFLDGGERTYEFMQAMSMPQPHKQPRNRWHECLAM